MLVGEKRKSLGALVTLKCLMDSSGIPTEELAPEASDYLRSCGLRSTV